MQNQATALTRAPAKNDALANITGSSRDPAAITRMLERAAEVAHVVSPVGTCPDLPEGLSIATSAVLVHPSELYEIPGGGKVGLTKAALDRIGMACGISWDPRESRRLDDGRTRNYAAYQAVGTYPLWDGSRAVCQGTKEIDLRDGSPAALTMSEKQLAGARLHILSMAESKAKNRAIRSLGVRPAYTREEVKKPFVCARAVFTGATDDPELKREFSRMLAQSFLGASASLYGNGPRELPAAPPPRAALPAGRPAPPVGAVVDDEGVIDMVPAEPEQSSGPTSTAPAVEPAPSTAASSPRSSWSEPARSPRPQSGEPRGDAVMRFGRAKGTRLVDADVDGLEWYASALSRSIDDPEKTRYREANQQHLDEVRAELSRRNGGGADVGSSGGDFEASGRATGHDDDIPFASSSMMLDVHPRAARWERW